MFTSTLRTNDILRLCRVSRTTLRRWVYLDVVTPARRGVRIKGHGDLFSYPQAMALAQVGVYQEAWSFMPAEHARTVVAAWQRLSDNEFHDWVLKIPNPYLEEGRCDGILPEMSQELWSKLRPRWERIMEHYRQRHVSASSSSSERSLPRRRRARPAK
jgi:hypothetical protein